MKRVIGLGCLLFCSAGSMGCGGDSAQTILRDALTTQNELCDIMMRATDEESAKVLVKTKLEPLKRKWESFQTRTKILSDMSPKQKEEAVDFELRYLDELTECALRLSDETDRLKEIRLQLFLEEYSKQRLEGFTPSTIDSETYALLGRGTVSKDLRDELRLNARPTAPVRDPNNPNTTPQGGGPSLAGMKAGQKHVIDLAQLYPGLTDLISTPKNFDFASIWSENPLAVRPSEFTTIPGFPVQPKTP